MGNMFINFWKFLKKNKNKWPQCLNWCKSELEFWCETLKSLLKYGFCDKSFQKDEPLLNTFSTYLSSLLGGFAIAPSKPTLMLNKKWGSNWSPNFIGVDNCALGFIKVSKSRKQFVMSKLLPKNEPNSLS
jgi:hypothetical protein